MVDASDIGKSYLEYFTEYFFKIFFFILIVGGLILLHLRRRWYPEFREWVSSRATSFHNCCNRHGDNNTDYLPVSGFENDVHQGLSSSNFDLISNNLDKSDLRSGLDENSKREILKIMNDNKSLSFDQARLFYTRRIMAENQIAPDGTPLDPRAVTFGNI